MEAYQQRVVEEHEALVEKLDKLSLFLNKVMAGETSLDDLEFERMTRQSYHMKMYAEVLAERIAEWNLPVERV